MNRAKKLHVPFDLLSVFTSVSHLETFMKQCSKENAQIDGLPAGYDFLSVLFVYRLWQSV
jgi:hypothetical protein